MVAANQIESKIGELGKENKVLEEPESIKGNIMSVAKVGEPKSLILRPLPIKTEHSDRLNLRIIFENGLFFAFIPVILHLYEPLNWRQLLPNIKNFRFLGVELLSVSVDSHFVHKMCQDNELSKVVEEGIPFPMLSNSPGNIGKVYGVYDKDSGVEVRAALLLILMD